MGRFKPVDSQSLEYPSRSGIHQTLETLQFDIVRSKGHYHLFKGLQTIQTHQMGPSSRKLLHSRPQQKIYRPKHAKSTGSKRSLDAKALTAQIEGLNCTVKTETWSTSPLGSAKRTTIKGTAPSSLASNVWRSLGTQEMGLAAEIRSKSIMMKLKQFDLVRLQLHLACYGGFIMLQEQVRQQHNMAFVGAAVE